MATGARKRRRRRATERCVSCTTERHPIEARGLCNRCYRLTLKMERLERGDLRPLGGLAVFRRPDHPLTEKFRKAYLREIREQLAFLRIREEQRRGLHLTPLAIEHLLRKLGKRAGALGDPHYNVATRISFAFPRDSQIALFQLLHEIEERIRWKPKIDFREVFRGAP
jgi:hypothetical protein